VVEQRTENPCVGSSILPRGTIFVGVWRSWLARVVWDDEVGGSSPLTPTILRLLRKLRMVFDQVNFNYCGPARRSAA
jgi:hypothetical protein